MHHFGVVVGGFSFPIVFSDVHPNTINRGIEKAQEITGIRFDELYQ